MLRSLYAVLTSTAFFLGLGSANAQSYQVEEVIEISGAAYVEPTDMNSDGWVVGSYYSGNSHYGFIWNHGAVTNLGKNVYPASINDAGYVVGRVDGINSAAFVYYQGTMTMLGRLWGHDGIQAISDINNSNQMVGLTQGEELPVLLSQGFTVPLEIPLPAPFFTAMTINDHGIVSGTILENGTKAKAIIWKHGSFQKLEFPTGAFDSHAYAANANGYVVGEVNWNGSWSDGNAALWNTSGQLLKELPLFAGAYWARALAINNSDVIVGESYISGGGFSNIRATLWLPGQPAFDLNDLIPPNSPVSNLYTPLAVKENGKILLKALKNNATVGVVLKP